MYYGTCANGECPFQKKKKISCFESHFLTRSRFQHFKKKKKKSNEMSISQPVTFNVQSEIIIIQARLAFVRL